MRVGLPRSTVAVTAAGSVAARLRLVTSRCALVACAPQVREMVELYMSRGVPKDDADRVQEVIGKHTAWMTGHYAGSTEELAPGLFWFLSFSSLLHLARRLENQTCTH